jgi:Leucine-rich repeat (LRR) protein
MILALTAVSTSAAQLLAPEDYKPTTVLGLNKPELEGYNSSPESRANQTDGEVKVEQKEEEQNNTPIADQDQKIIQQLERELGVQIPKAEIKYSAKEKIGYIRSNGYALNSEGRVSHLDLGLGESQVQSKHLPLIGKLDSLQYLDLEFNQISKIEGLENLTGLKWLSFYGNQISKIEGLDNLISLQELNLRRNQISKIEGLDKLGSLQSLSLRNNRIGKIEGLDKLSSMQYLNLDYNPITKIEGLDSLANLQSLSFYYSLITKVEGLDKLSSLQTLDIRFSRIKEIKGLDELADLQSLLVSYNQISKVEGLESLTSLQLLDLSFNQISKIEGLDKLTSLKELNFWDNQITDATPLEALLLNQKKAGKPVLDISRSLDIEYLQTPPMEVVEEGSEAFLEWVEENR